MEGLDWTGLNGWIQTDRQKSRGTDGYLVYICLMLVSCGGHKMSPCTSLYSVVCIL